MKYESGDIVYFFKDGIHKGVILFAYTYECKDIGDRKTKKHNVYLIEKSTLGGFYDRFEFLGESELHVNKTLLIESIDKTK